MENNRLPKDQATLICGIISIVMGLCCQPVGIILGILSLVWGNSGMKLYESEPDAYNPSSFSNIKTGRLLGIIGLVISVAFLVYQIFFFDMEAYQEMMEQFMGAAGE